MAYVIAEPYIGTKDTACVDACPVDCIHPEKEHDLRGSSSRLEDVPELYIDLWSASNAGPVCLFALFKQFFALDDLPQKTEALRGI